jgi:hypothetical protein
MKYTCATEVHTHSSGRCGCWLSSHSWLHHHQMSCVIVTRPSCEIHLATAITSLWLSHAILHHEWH